MSLVSQAKKAFAEKNYPYALVLYQKAGDLVGHKFFAANIALCKKRCDAKQGILNKPGTPRATHDSNGLLYADQFKVALIADEFTTNSFSDEFQAIAIEPDNWQELFEKHQPDIFFCESAWSGPDAKQRPWKGRVYASKNFAKENRTALLSILKHCRSKGIPTIFWNKEDPTHHTDKVHDFVKTAQEFDFVFTTAAECVDSYKNNYNVKNAFALPFATNPKLFNPIEIGHRSSNVVFAGSWYANHKKRSMDMSDILDSIVADGFKLEIYDRYYGDSDPLHKWPEKYENFLLPSKPHNEMPKVYKSGLFGLNFNTVTNSPTMFARRVFELMSSNTLVISNDSAGTREMFGDLIIYPDKEPDRLRTISKDEVDDIRARALKKALSEHTYTQRWHSILTKIGIRYAKRDNTLTFIAKITKRADALSAIAWFQQHGASLNDSKLLLVASKDMPELEIGSFYKEFNRFGVTVTSFSHASLYAIPDRYQPIETTHFIEINESHLADPDHIKDSLLHLQYMQEHPIVLTNDSSKRYCILPIAEGAMTINPANSFGTWLTSSNESKYGYYV